MHLCSSKCMSTPSQCSYRVVPSLFATPVRSDLRRTCARAQSLTFSYRVKLDARGERQGGPVRIATPTMLPNAPDHNSNNSAQRPT
eukprot:scaffold167447_cov33-Tisochrysis_lutea.AAC.2